MKTIVLTLTALLLAGAAHAQTTAKDELNRLSTNVSSAEHNLAQYKDNLKQVESNLKEVEKAKKKLEAQAAKVTAEAKTYEAELAKFAETEVQLKKEQQAEKDALAAEAKQVAEVQALLQKLQQNQKIRQENVENYTRTLEAMNLEKAQWQEQLTAIRGVEKDAAKKIAEAEKQESTWQGKKRGYEGEVNRWSKEMERQKDLHRTYSSLAEKN